MGARIAWPVAGEGARATKMNEYAGFAG